MVVKETWDFPNHYPYALSDVLALIRRAQRIGARLVTTPKDFVRLPAQSIVDVAGLELVWEDEAGFMAFVKERAGVS